MQGDPSKESELDKIRLTHGAAVIVSGARDMSLQNADARTILIAFTIRGFLRRQARVIRKRLRPLYVVAEILDSENVGHELAAGADEVVETRRIAYSMIAHAVGHHGTATTMCRFLTPGAHAAYIGKIPDPPVDPVPLGDLLARMRLSTRGGLVIGVRAPSGEETINPPKQFMVEPGTLLIYLAEAPLLEPPS